MAATFTLEKARDFASQKMYVIGFTASHVKGVARKVLEKTPVGFEVDSTVMCGTAISRTGSPHQGVWIQRWRNVYLQFLTPGSLPHVEVVRCQPECLATPLRLVQLQKIRGGTGYCKPCTSANGYSGLTLSELCPRKPSAAYKKPVLFKHT